MKPIAAKVYRLDRDFTLKNKRARNWIPFTKSDKKTLATQCKGARRQLKQKLNKDIYDHI